MAEGSQCEALPVGTLAKISGLKAAPQLNGHLCQVARPGDNPERVVVRTRLGEKSLKPANLEVGLGIFPDKLQIAAVALFLSTFTVVADILRSAGHSSPSATAAPLLFGVWVYMTLGVCYWLHRPIKESDTWVPAVHDMGSEKVSRGVYRMGSLTAGLLLAVTIFLYAELLLTHIGPAPPPAPVPAPSPPPATSLQNSSNTSAEVAPQATEPAPPQAEPTNDADAAEPPQGANATNATGPPKESPLVWMPQRSMMWGFVAAVGLGVQSFFKLELKRPIRSLIKLSGAIAFFLGILLHSQHASAVLSSSRGQPIRELSLIVQKTNVLRRTIAEFAPLIMLMIPVGSSLFSKKPAITGDVKNLSSMYAETGMMSSIIWGQWGIIIIYTFFVSTYSVDFWFASRFLGDGN